MVVFLSATLMPFQNSNYGVSRNTRQDRSIQRSRYYFVADHEECVGSTNFFNILSVNAVQPQDLLVTLCMSFFLSLEAGCIVAAAFSFAGTAVSRTNVLVFNIQLCRSQAANIVRSNRA